MPQFTGESAALNPPRGCMSSPPTHAAMCAPAGRTTTSSSSDNFHPARSGSGSLYTVEHFRAVRVRLAPGGVFCQWLPLHQLDLPTPAQHRAFLHHGLPQGTALLASNSLETPVLGLVGRADDMPFPRAPPRNRIQSRYGLEDFLRIVRQLCRRA